MTKGEQTRLIFENPDSTHQLLDGLELTRPLVVFDLETTGLDIELDRIIQFAFLRVNPDRSVEEWQELVNPAIPIPPEASRVHGITDDQVADHPDFSHFAPIVLSYINNSDLCGFNIAQFDVPFLQAEMQRNGYPLDTDQISIIDAKTIYHMKEPRDLASAYRFYCQADHDDAHDAMGDVRVTLDVLDAQLERYSDLPRTMNALVEYCSPRDDRFVTSDRKFYWRHGKALISFGKYRGKSLEFLSSHDPGYLKWIIDGNFAKDTKHICQNALNGQFPSREDI